jgi:hypothetical protein
MSIGSGMSIAIVWGWSGMGASCPIRFGAGQGLYLPSRCLQRAKRGAAHNDPHIISERVSREFGGVGCSSAAACAKAGVHRETGAGCVRSYGL